MILKNMGLNIGDYNQMVLNKLGFDINKKILITGCAGFIGSNLLEFFLKKGCDVVGLDNLSTGCLENIELAKEEASEENKNFKFNFIKGDIRDFNCCLNATKKINIVFHEAALGSVQRSFENPMNSSTNNIESTLNILKASLENKVERFIYASSSSVYGDTPVLPKTEEMPVNPKSIYAVTKLTSEYYCRLFYSLYGLKTISLRYFNVFGKRQNPNSIYSAVIPLFLKNIISNKPPIIFGDGEQSRDFTYIDNVIYANYLAATIENNNIFGNFYNVACANKISLNSIIEFLSDYFKKEIKPVYKEERIGDVKHSLASLEKVNKDLKYYPIIDFFEGLKKLILKFQF